MWTTVWLAVALITLERSGHEVEELLDAQLAQTAQVLRRITLAGHVGDMAAAGDEVPVPGHFYESRISFQLWQHGGLVNRFGGAPADALADRPGFSSRDIGDVRWRVYGLATGRPGEVLFVGQSYAIRDELVRYLTLQALQPILWSLPLTVLLIWLAVSDGLRPLRRLAEDVGCRSAERLAPVNECDVPAEVRPLTNALNRLMVDLSEALSAERRFAADASHELRTPLAVIRTHAQIARRAQDPRERAEALERLEQGVDRAVHLVSQLIAFARLEGADAGAGRPAASLVDAVVQTLADKEAMAADRSITLGFTLPEEDLGVVQADATALEILVGNLIDNALKYTPPGGRVEIRVQRGGERILLTVTDSGPGIPPADRELVFQRFRRQGDHAVPGAGLGLSIVQRICELHGARILLADGDGGVGLRVEVSFPSAA